MFLMVTTFRDSLTPLYRPSITSAFHRAIIIPTRTSEPLISVVNLIPSFEVDISGAKVVAGAASASSESSSSSSSRMTSCGEDISDNGWCLADATVDLYEDDNESDDDDEEKRRLVMWKLSVTRQ